MPNASITIYKLIILYILSKVDVPLPSGIISDYITKQGYTNYFTLQNVLGELLQADLIQEDVTYHLSYYAITETGRQTLALFGTPLSVEIRKEIDDYLQKNKFEIIDETSFISDYSPAGNGTYMASCMMQERGHVMFRLELEVTTEEDAIKVCENWQSNSEALYRTAITHLLN